MNSAPEHGRAAQLRPRSADHGDQHQSLLPRLVKRTFLNPTLNPLNQNIGDLNVLSSPCPAPPHCHSLDDSYAHLRLRESILDFIKHKESSEVTAIRNIKKLYGLGLNEKLECIAEKVYMDFFKERRKEKGQRASSRTDAQFQERKMKSMI